MRFAWGSARFSEDIDFLVLDEATEQIGKALVSASRVLKEHLLVQGFHGEVEVKKPVAKSPGGLHVGWINYHDSSFGGEKIKVKCEFLPVTAEQLGVYRSSIRPVVAPEIDSRIHALINVADLDSLRTDKVVAIVNRPTLKMRDIFDIWWLEFQAREKSDAEALLPIWAAEMSIYGLDMEDFVEAAKLRADDLKAALGDGLPVRLADDLRLWLPKNYFGLLESQPETFAAMVDTAASKITESVALIEENRQKIEEILGHVSFRP